MPNGFRDVMEDDSTSQKGVSISHSMDLQLLDS